MKKIVLSILFFLSNNPLLVSMENLHKQAQESDLTSPLIKNDIATLNNMNIFANGLLAQAQLMKSITEFVHEFSDYIAIKKQALHDKHFCFDADGNLVFEKNEISLEALSLVFRYPDIFMGLFNYTHENLQDLKDRQYQTVKNWVYIPGIKDLVKKWQESNDSDVQFLASLIDIQLRASENDKKMLEKRNVLFKITQRFNKNNGDLYYLSDLTALPNNWGKELEMLTLGLSAVIEFHDKGLAAGQQNKKIAFEDELRLYHVFDCLDKNYKNYETRFQEIYQWIRDKIFTLAPVQKNKNEALHYKRLRKCVPIQNISHQTDSHIFKSITFDFVFEGLLPEELPQIDCIYEEEDISHTTDPNEWLPDYLKKPKKMRKKPAVPNKKKNKKIEKKSPIKKILKAADGSEIIEETDEYFLINDEKNDLTSKILKSEKSTQELITPSMFNSVKITDWVNAWYENPEKAFEEQGYMYFESKKYTNPLNFQKTKAIHSPAQIMRSLLLQWAKQTKTPSRRVHGKEDILLTLPGVNYYKDGSLETGLFVYIIDSDNFENYHVNFETRTGKKLMEDYLMKGYFDVEFPELKSNA